MAYQFDRNDVYGFAIARSAETTEKGDELFFKRCPYCNGGDHDLHTFSINLETGAFKCFRHSCGKQGHFVELARDFDFQLDFGYAKKKFVKLEQKPIVIKDQAIEYMASRGIDEATTRKYQLTMRNDQKNVLVFPFHNENGVLVSAKYRHTDYDPKKHNSKEFFFKGTMPILFGMMQCVGFDRLIITEGQIDSLTVACCGIDNAVSVPTGALGFKWIDNCYDWVNRFSEIVIFGDCEKDGKVTLVDGISSRFPNKIIKIVRVEDYLGEKDANDILRKYGKDAVIKCVENAQIKPVKAVKRLADVKAVDLEKLEHIKTGIYDLDKVIYGIYPGQVALLTGKRGDGKSTLASQIIANALEQGYGVFVYSGELPDYHFKRWLDMQIAGSEHIEESQNEYGDQTYWISDQTVEKINAWYHDRAFIFDNTAVLDELATESKRNAHGEDITLLGSMEQAVCRYGLRIVLIDNLMCALDADMSSDLYRAQSDFVKRVKALAVKLNIAVLLIAHPRKEQDGKQLSNDSVSGSSDITNAVDMVMTYYANDDDDKNEYQSRIGVTKNRLTGKKLVDDSAIKVSYSCKSKRIACKNDDYKKVYGCFTGDECKEPVAPPF